MNNHIPLIRPSECDDFRGTFPLKSVTIDKILSSTSDLEKAISDIMLLLENNADSITIEQSEKSFVETASTLEIILTSIINYRKMQKSPQLRSIITSSSNNCSVFSLFYDYIQLAIRVYNQKIFYNPSFYPFVIFFTNLCCYYIDIFQNPSQNLKKDFQNAWSDYFSISTRLHYFYKESGIPREFNKFDHAFDASEIAKIQQIAENSFYNIYQSIQTVKKDIKEYDKEESTTLIKNTIIDLEVLRSNFYELQTYSSDNSDHNILTEKLNAINSLLASLESCISFYNLYEMTNKLNLLIRNEVFVLPNDIVQNNYSNWLCFKLAIQAINLNLKLMLLIRQSLNNIDQKIIDCYKLCKAIISLVENSNELKMTEIIDQFLDYMRQIQLITDNSAFKKFITFYEEQVDNMMKAFENKNKDTALKVKNYFDNFKKSTKVFEEKRNFPSATSCFSYFSNFEDCFRDLKKSAQSDNIKIDENLFKVRYNVELNIIFFSNETLLYHVQRLSTRITQNPSFYNSIEKQRALKSAWNTMLNSITLIYSDNNEPRDAEIFLCFFKLFLKVCMTVIDLNVKDQNDKYGEVISFIMTYFPQNERMKVAIPINRRIEDLRVFIGKIQANALKVSEVVFSPAETKDIKPSANKKESKDTTLVKFFECEEGMIEISNALKLLETIRQIIRFFLNYNQFINTYNLHESPSVYRQGQSITPYLFDYFPHFSNELICMLKWEDLKIDISPNFMREWLAFIRSLILNECFSRKDSFLKMIYEMPFIDYSKLIRKSLLNFYKINSIVSKTLDSQKAAWDNEPDIMVQSINDKEKKYNEESFALKKLISNLIVTFKFDNTNYIGNNNLISSILQISSELYQSVQDYWAQLIQIFRFYEKFSVLIKLVQDLRADFEIEKKEFSSSLCQYTNLVFCINLSLNEINKSCYISNEMKMVIAEFNQATNEARSIFKNLFYDDVKPLEEKIYIPFLLKMQDLENVLLQTSIYQFTNQIRSIFAHSLPIIASACNDAFYTSVEDAARDILSLVDLIEDEKNENRFSILYRIKRRVKQIKFNFHEPFLIEFYQKLKTSVDCEINITFIKTLIAIHNIFVLQIASENQRIISLLVSKSSSFHKINNLPAICQIPEISQKFDYIIHKYCSQKKPKTVNDNEFSEILTNMASNLMYVKLNAESRVREIISSLDLDERRISEVKNSISNYMKLKSVYQSKLDLLNETRQETKALKARQNEKINTLQQQLIRTNQDLLKLLYEFRKLSDIEKKQQDQIKKASENLQWAKQIQSSLSSKFAERRKSKAMNPVLPVIRNDLKEGQIPFALPKTGKVSYAKVLEIEQRFQKTYEKNKQLWEKARSFSKGSSGNGADDDTNDIDGDMKCDMKNEHERIGHSALSKKEAAKEFNTTIETVYELFKRSTFIQQLLFSQNLNENDNVSHLNYGSLSNSSSNSNLNAFSSASSSANVSAQNSGNIANAGIGGSGCDEEEILSLIDAFNNELFDRSLNFYFINKILERKSVKKLKRKVRVKKNKKSVMSEIVEGELLQ